MSTLCVYDVSTFVYVGNYAKDVYAEKLLGFPVRGIYYMNKYLAYDLSQGNDVVLCFDSKSFRKKLYKGYKSNRINNPEIWAQIDFLYEYYNRIGIVCHKVDGYEADDLMFNVVEHNRSKYSEIVVYGTDYDLCHNVCFKTRFESINSITNSVDYRNFKHAVVKDAIIPFNTITAYKVFMGDNSDTVNMFKGERASGATLYKYYLKAMEQAVGSDPMIIRTRKALQLFLDKIRNDLGEADYKQLMTRMDIFFPAVVDEDKYDVNFSEASNRKNIDLAKLGEYLSNLVDNRSLKHLGMKSKGFKPEVRDDIRRRAKDLSTGAYAVRNNISTSPCVRMDSESFFVGEF
ncbi:5'-3' exonuclease H3TH domain-containing protein [Paraclostridium bifermentans]